MANVYDKERVLEREISGKVAEALPGVEVLAVELTGPERFTVYVDRDGGVDHALCEQVTHLLPVLRGRQLEGLGPIGLADADNARE